MDSINYVNKLIEIKKLDQKYRSGNPKNERFLKYQPNLDSQNRYVLDSLYQIYGFPSIKKVGYKGYDAAWIVLHHSTDCSWIYKWLNLFLSDFQENKKGDYDPLLWTINRHFFSEHGNCDYIYLDSLISQFPNLKNNLHQSQSNSK